MNILEMAEEDLAITLENEDDFGIPVTLEDPDSNTYTGLFAQSTDIAFLIEPGTGMGVRGRVAECNFRLSSVLTATSGVIPNNKWFAKFEDVNGDEWTFIMALNDIDRKLGILKSTLEMVNVS